MSVGVRRTLRAGAQSGVPLEDLGVRPRKKALSHSERRAREKR